MSDGRPPGEIFEEYKQGEDMAAVFAVVTVSDYLHQAYQALMKEASG